MFESCRAHHFTRICVTTSSVFALLVGCLDLIGMPRSTPTVLGAAAAKSTLPPGVRGIPSVGWLIHCA